MTRIQYSWIPERDHCRIHHIKTVIIKTIQLLTSFDDVTSSIYTYTYNDVFSWVMCLSEVNLLSNQRHSQSIYTRLSC